MRANPFRTSENVSEKKPLLRKQLHLGRANSFSLKTKAKSPDVSPVISSNKLGRSFSSSVIKQTNQRKSDLDIKEIKTPVQRSEPVKFPSLKSEFPKLPRTDPPKARRPYAIKKRFENMSATLERIPSCDSMDSWLYSTPIFARVLEKNIEKCKMRLAKAKLVKEAIKEEDGDASERSNSSALEKTKEI